MLSHASLTSIPILGRTVNTNQIGQLLDQTGIEIREEDCASCAIYDLVIGNIPGEHPDILGNCGKTTENEVHHGRVTPYIEASKFVVTPINSVERVGFKVNANTCTEIEGSTQVGPSTKDIGEEKGGIEQQIGKVKVIGGAVQTRGGRARELHPMKPLLIRGDTEYQQCSPKQLKEAQGQDQSLARFFEWVKEPRQGNDIGCSAAVCGCSRCGDYYLHCQRLSNPGLLM